MKIFGLKKVSVLVSKTFGLEKSLGLENFGLEKSLGIGLDEIFWSRHSVLDRTAMTLYIILSF